MNTRRNSVGPGESCVRKAIASVWPSNANAAGVAVPSMAATFVACASMASPLSFSRTPKKDVTMRVGGGGVVMAATFCPSDRKMKNVSFAAVTIGMNDVKSGMLMSRRTTLPSASRSTPDSFEVSELTSISNACLPFHAMAPFHVAA